MADGQRVLETDLYDPIRLALSAARLAIVFRNHVGVSHHAADRAVRHGLPAGSSDLIGWTLPGPVWPGGIFCAIEVKRPGWKPPPAWKKDRQAAFLRAIRAAGGVAFIARSADEAVAILSGEARPVYPVTGGMG